MGLANLLGGISIVILGLLVTISSSRMSYQAEYGPGPGFLPIWIGMVLLFFGIMTVVGTVRSLNSQQKKFFLPGTRKVIVLLFTLVATILLIPVLGLAAALSLFTGFTMRASGRHSWILCLFVTVAVGLGIKWIFGHVLDIPLPRGRIGF